MTTGILNGTALLIYVDGVSVSHGLSFEISISHATRDATTKDSSGWEDSLEGLRSWSMSGSAKMAYDATLSFEDLYANISTRGTITVLFSTEVSGDIYYTGTAYITEMTQTGGVEDSVEYTFTFKGTGELTEGIQT